MRGSNEIIIYNEYYLEIEEAAAEKCKCLQNKKGIILLQVTSKSLSLYSCCVTSCTTGLWFYCFKRMICEAAFGAKKYFLRHFY